MYARDFKREFGSVYRFAHCDCLVLVPTDNKMYVLNPATRDLLTLPESPRRMRRRSDVCRPTVGFGRDPLTNKYKVVQCFRHSEDHGLGNYITGTEVLRASPVAPPIAYGASRAKNGAQSRVP